uniref:RRM domain-containing protein n=1 Tax=Corethron hystrix TaxID=216773 RepID=A0A7S1FV97_9STRA|mmetsp:Transcript_31247/g.71474  ORF Transcript_31247/g.71474 Transcript_31247/m.71474 type:complete len:128 (+) Transcript_31247:626-1009(+)
MRKKCPKEKLEQTFARLGDIENVSVAPDGRGFGLVRFKTPKSVRHAMEAYKRGDIIVYEVEVTVKLLKSYASSPNNSANNLRLLGPLPGSERPDVRQEGGEGNGRAARGKETHPGAEARSEHQIFSL